MLIYWGADLVAANTPEEIQSTKRCLVLCMAAGCNQFGTACGGLVRKAILGGQERVTCETCKDWIVRNE